MVGKRERKANGAGEHGSLRAFIFVSSCVLLSLFVPLAKLGEVKRWEVLVHSHICEALGIFLVYMWKQTAK